MMIVGNALTTYVAGKWSDPDRHIDVLNPADGGVVGSIGYSGREGATAAVDAAQQAGAEWSSWSARQRAEILLAVADQLTQRADEIGRVLAQETGKRRPEAIGEVRMSAEYFRWFAEAVRQPVGEIAPNEMPGRRHITRRRPAGVAVCLTPWNFPVSIPARKIAPALAAGCTLVCRGSEKAPLSLVKLFGCLEDAGLPPGVANLVHGPAAELTETMLAHPATRVVSFTGSTDVGRHVMRLAASRIVRPALELGGDAAFIVFDDADLDAAVEGALIAKFRNNGQSCIAANRFLIHDRIYETFVERLTDAVDAMTIGDPTADAAPDLGPLIDRDRVQAVQTLVTEALDAGATRLTASRDVPSSGTFYPPTLLGNVPEQVGLSCSEVFGPVAGMYRFSTEEEALSRANATEMGLAGYLYTRDLSRAWRISEQLDVGMVGCNNPVPTVVYTPMGGTKQSGLGREGGHEGLAEFQEVQYTAMELG